MCCEAKRAPMRPYNKSRHRMSGNNVNFKFEHRGMPLIGALQRYADS